MKKDFNFLELYINSIKQISNSTPTMIFNEETNLIFTTPVFDSLVDNPQDIITINQDQEKEISHKIKSYKGKNYNFSKIVDPFNGKVLATLVELNSTHH